MRQPFFDVYAFCRTADDAADESASPAEATEALAKFRRSIAGLFDGGEVAGPFLALAVTVRRFDLPRKPFDDLLDAFVQDQSVHRYSDESQLWDYCRRSANPVGRLVLAMAGCDSDEHYCLSDEICTALQLANFWQDVGRDYAIGRIYLPESVMQRHGFDESVIANTIERAQPTPGRVREAIAEQCDCARDRFERGRPLARIVPPWLAADIDLFALGGLATLDAIAKLDYDVLQHRPQVPKRTQAGFVMRALMRRLTAWSHPSSERTSLSVPDRRQPS
ncbi:All-trans-phytoene synthase [Allorhodopirellula solitaria]|uniref:All-trans-phytoene synthase n=2 Tax=Allorhodopirellula solitaria TaxID=2527987 RepID=A0A5C5XND4_9BACT|nr:All-trans-phytoene synthase [Allorhodopirellula solitaria]